MIQRTHRSRRQQRGRRKRRRRKGAAPLFAAAAVVAGRAVMSRSLRAAASYVSTSLPPPPSSLNLRQRRGSVADVESSIVVSFPFRLFFGEADARIVPRRPDDQRDLEAAPAAPATESADAPPDLASVSSTLMAEKGPDDLRDETNRPWVATPLLPRSENDGGGWYHESANLIGDSRKTLDAGMDNNQGGSGITKSEAVVQNFENSTLPLLYSTYVPSAFASSRAHAVRNAGAAVFLSLVVAVILGVAAVRTRSAIERRRAAKSSMKKRIYRAREGYDAPWKRAFLEESEEAGETRGS